MVLGTAAKWATVAGTAAAWPWAIVDEAYQMRSDLLLRVAVLFEKALFVGDPGQPFTWLRPRESSFFEAVLGALHRLLTG